MKKRIITKNISKTKVDFYIRGEGEDSFTFDSTIRLDYVPSAGDSFINMFEVIEVKYYKTRIRLLLQAHEVSKQRSKDRMNAYKEGIVDSPSDFTYEKHGEMLKKAGCLGYLDK